MVFISGALHADVWSRMPNDLFWTHILPRCDIDTRVGFKARAPRVKLPPVDTTLKAELDRYLIWRRDGPKALPVNDFMGYSYTIPYWKHGSMFRRFGAPSAYKWTHKPKVYLYIWNSWLGYSYDDHWRKISWQKPKGTIMVDVGKVDIRGDETHIATFFIEPSSLSLASRTDLRCHHHHLPPT